MSNTQDRIKSGTGSASEALYKLDNYLSNRYFGDGSKSDRQITRVRKQLKVAMNSLASWKIFPMLKGIE